MIIVFSGYNQRAVLAFLRTLEKNKIHDYCIIAASEMDTILHTSYKSKVFHIRKMQALVLREMLHIVEMVKQKMPENTPLFIMPSTEALNRFLLEYRSDFEKIGCCIPLVDKALYERISDKDKFEEMCRKYDILTPARIDLSEEYKVPIVAKPRKYYAVDGKAYSPIFIRSKSEYDHFGAIHDPDDFFYSEFLEGGDSFYLLYYIDSQRNVYCISQENLAQQPEGKSIVAARIAGIDQISTICEPYKNMLLAEKFRGLIMIELRFIRNNYYMIEANPRFWGPSQLFCDAGYNLFELLLNDYGIYPKMPSLELKRDTVYYWSGGIGGATLEDSDCDWYGAGKEIMEVSMEEFIEADIYKRKDSLNIYYEERLRQLYAAVSKHSGYQILPTGLRGILDQSKIKICSRQEEERLDYITKMIDISGKTILDIGGNTGYFSMESIQLGAQHVDYYEGNTTHAEFVQIAANLLQVEEKISIHPEYYMFHGEAGHYDICYCLNVIHHLGDDFHQIQKKDEAKAEMANCINALSQVTDILVLQIGFNWKGDIKECLFENGTKGEMIDFVKIATKDYWQIQFIGIAQKRDGKVIYEETNQNNLKRQDELGEFLNRPIFIMQSKKSGR